MKAKYLRGCPLLACERKEGSQFWHAIQSIKEHIILGAVASVGNGRDTLFWLDSWFGGRPLRDVFPDLFAICAEPLVSIASAFQQGQWNIGFRRTFGPGEVASWRSMLASLPLSLSDSSDRVA